MKRECRHCEDGHMAPDAKPWGAFVDVFKDGDGQPTTISVQHVAGEHVAESDAEWIRERLNGQVLPGPADALDGLQAFSKSDDIEELLPGLGAVIMVLRGQIAEAMIEQARRDSDREKEALASRISTGTISGSVIHSASGRLSGPAAGGSVRPVLSGSLPRVYMSPTPSDLGTLPKKKLMAMIRAKAREDQARRR